MKTLPLLSLLPLTAVLFPCPVHAAPPPVAPRPIETAPAAQLYAEATLDLREGHRFESVAARLREAARQSPDDFRIPLALGCALASRAASLAYAESYAGMLADEQASFPDRLKEWRAAQKDPKADDFGAPEPTEPPQIVFRTKDDHTPFKLTPAQTLTEVSRLGLAAASAWNKAVALAKTPDEMAEAQNVRGWGLRMVGGAGVGAAEDDEDDPAMTKARAAPDVQAFRKVRTAAKTEAVKAFEAAVKAAPDNADYWQGLGDALKSPFSSDALPPRAAEAYRMSLKLKPRNVALWYRLSSLLVKTDPKGSEDALKQAAAQDTSNAYAFYQLAALHFKQTAYDILNSTARDPEQKAQYEKAQAAVKDEKIKQAGRQAVDEVEQGNAAPRCERPVYKSPVPKLLRAAWGYFMGQSDMDFSQFANLRSLARAAGGYAMDIAPRDMTEAARACRAAVGLGLKMCGDWPLRDSSAQSSEVLQMLVGTAVAAIGYKAWERLTEQYGDAGMQAQATAQYDAFKKKREVWQAVRAKVEDESIYAGY